MDSFLTMIFMCGKKNAAFSSEKAASLLLTVCYRAVFPIADGCLAVSKPCGHPR